MLDNARSRLTYANVISTLALFLALGGSSYAALALPRNSVGSVQIRAKAVSASELRSRSVSSRVIRDGSISLRDLSAGSRSSLRGQAGPAGPAGASGIAYSAAVDASGTRVVRGNASRVDREAGTNNFVVTFPRDMSECVSTATLATVDGGSPVEPPAGRITVGRAGVTLLVRTFNVDGTATPLPFNLLAAC